MRIVGSPHTGGLKYKPMTAVNKLVVHCAATQPKADIGVADIERWHRERGFICVGYHYVIRRDGTIERGRPEDMAGAHAAGFNSDSIGICLAGGINAKGKAEDNFTPAQKLALYELLHDLKERYPTADILGHRDLPGVKKDCPSFDTRRWWASVNSK